MRIIEAPNNVIEPVAGSVVLDRDGVAWQRHPGDKPASAWLPARLSGPTIFGHISTPFVHLLVERGPLRVIWDAADEPVDIDARPARTLADQLDRIPEH